MNIKWIEKPQTRRLIGLVIIGAAIAAGTTIYGISQFPFLAQTPAPVPEETPPPPARKVTALGRLEPEGEVVRVGAPLSLDGDRLTEILVKEGDKVQAGQVIAVLDSRDRLQSALEQAKEQVKAARARLEQVKAGAKQGEITAQQATIGRLQAEWEGTKKAQQATLDRVEAEWEGNKNAKQEEIARIEAEWQGEKTAQEATIKKIEAELRNALSELNRYEKLYADGAISRSVIDTKQLTVDTTRQQVSEAKANLARINGSKAKQLSEAKANLSKINTTGVKQLEEAKVTLTRINDSGVKQLNEAKATLNKIAEVRPVDVQAAQSEVDNALAAVKRAQVELNQAYVRSPNVGQIIKIHTRPGEKLSTNGIADLGQTDQMQVVAEVYQTDIALVKIGQEAVITSQAFEGELKGNVSFIGLQVGRQNVFSNQPGENLDSRIVEVKIRLTPEASKQVAGLTNLQVNVQITPE